MRIYDELFVYSPMKPTQSRSMVELNVIPVSATTIEMICSDLSSQYPGKLIFTAIAAELIFNVRQMSHFVYIFQIHDICVVYLHNTSYICHCYAC